MARSLQSQMACYQPEICSQTRRTLYHSQSPIVHHIRTKTPEDVENPPGISCFSLIALWQKPRSQPKFPKTPS